MAEKFEMEVELKSSPEDLWNTVKDINFVYPKLLPHVYDGIEILEGDGRSAGTIRRVNLKNGNKLIKFSFPFFFLLYIYC